MTRHRPPPRPAPVPLRIHAGLVAAVAVVTWNARLHACPICFQVADDATAAGIRAAVLVLIGVTLSVLAGVGWFAVGLVRRARAARSDQPHSTDEASTS